MKANCTVWNEITGQTRTSADGKEELIIKYSLVKAIGPCIRLKRTGRRHLHFEVEVYPDLAMLGTIMEPWNVLRMLNQCNSMKPVVLALNYKAVRCDMPKAFYKYVLDAVEGHFVRAEDEDDERPEEMTFDEVLTDAKERNIYVIALLPPIKETTRD